MFEICLLEGEDKEHFRDFLRRTPVLFVEVGWTWMLPTGEFRVAKYSGLRLRES